MSTAPEKYAGPVVRVVVADDAKELRELVVRLLARDPRINVVGQADDTQGALDVIADTRPDVALVDLSMPGAGGLFVLTEVARTQPECRMVVLSGLPASQAEAAAREAGAALYLEKGAAMARITRAVLDVAGVA